MSATLDFDTIDLARRVEQLSPVEIDALAFGAVRLAGDGTVEFYSRGETRLSGYGDRPTLGKNFFVDIAPCFANDDFLGRIERARALGQLDIEFGAIGDFDNGEKELRIRVQSAANGGIWIFLKRE